MPLTIASFCLGDTNPSEPSPEEDEPLSPLSPGAQNFVSRRSSKGPRRSSKEGEEPPCLPGRRRSWPWLRTGGEEAASAIPVSVPVDTLDPPTLDDGSDDSDYLVSESDEDNPEDGLLQLDLTTCVEEMVLRRRRFLKDLRELAGRSKMALSAVLSIVATSLISRIPIGAFRHGLSACVVACCTWQSFSAVQVMRSAGDAKGNTFTSLTSFARQNGTLVLVVLGGAISTIVCAVDGVRHDFDSADRLGDELGLFLAVGLLYFCFSCCAWSIFCWGRDDAEGMGQRLIEQLDTEEPLPTSSKQSLGDDLVIRLRRIMKRTYHLAQAVLCIAVVLLLAVPKLVQVLHKFNTGLYLLWYGMTSLSTAASSLEFLMVKIQELDFDEMHVLRMCLFLISGLMTTLVGTMVMEPEKPCKSSWLRGAVWLSTLCMADASSVITRTYIQVKRQSSTRQLKRRPPSKDKTVFKTSSAPTSPSVGLRSAPSSPTAGGRSARASETEAHFYRNGRPMAFFLNGEKMELE